MMNLLATALVAATAMYSPVSVTKADIEQPKVVMVEPVLRPATQAVPQKVQKGAIQLLEVRTMLVTAYTSAPEETDDTPFITASGTQTRDGVVATNELPMGTKIRIPAYFGDKIFTVEDRMHPRMKNKVDVWMATKAEAFHFGIREAQIQVVKEI